ncbi:MAG: antitoxin [Gemmatimonadetes bacterium]|nr:antitoxin [Gemmatimonadota bacterium]
MRLTLNLADDVIRAARARAEAERISLGDVISDLAREALGRARCIGTRNGFPVFGVSAETPPLTPEMVRRALNDG